MPFYDYRCVDCGEKDHRIGGLDDSVAICQECRGLMLRLDAYPFVKIFEDAESEAGGLPCQS